MGPCCCINAVATAAAAAAAAAAVRMGPCDIPKHAAGVAPSWPYLAIGPVHKDRDAHSKARQIFEQLQREELRVLLAQGIEEVAAQEVE